MSKPLLFLRFSISILFYPRAMHHNPNLQPVWPKPGCICLYTVWCPDLYIRFLKHFQFISLEKGCGLTIVVVYFRYLLTPEYISKFPLFFISNDTFLRREIKRHISLHSFYKNSKELREGIQSFATIKTYLVLVMENS